MEQAFETAYKIVFDENDEIKPCGREATKKLILAARKLDPSKEFGNAETGIMNTYMVQQLYRDTCKK